MLSIFTVAIAAKYVFDSATVVSCIVTGFEDLAKIAEKTSDLKVVKNKDFQAATERHEKRDERLLEQIGIETSLFITLEATNELK